MMLFPKVCHNCPLPCTPLQIRQSYVPITPADYDDAALRTPSVCLHRASGDNRSGAQLLADAPADARVPILSLARNADGCNLVRRLIAALRGHLAAYARAVGGVGPVNTVGALYVQHPAAEAHGDAGPACGAPPHAATALWQPTRDNTAPYPPCPPPAAAARRAAEPPGRARRPGATDGGGGDAARGGGKWGAGEAGVRLEGADPFHDDWAFWDSAPPPV